MVNDFSLPKGPAEVPAFYDFHALQIAFDHVLMQLFDEAIPDLAYTANTIGRSKFGVEGIVSSAFNKSVSRGSPPIQGNPPSAAPSR